MSKPTIIVEGRWYRMAWPKRCNWLQYRPAVVRVLDAPAAEVSREIVKDAIAARPDVYAARAALKAATEGGSGV